MTEIQDIIQVYLDLKFQKKACEERMAELKQEIDIYADSCIDEFKNGSLPLGNATIKIAQNPPKCIYQASEKALTPKDRQEIAQILGESYSVIDLDIKEVLRRQGNDKVLDKTLSAKGIKIVQETRYDIK